MAVWRVVSHVVSRLLLGAFVIAAPGIAGSRGGLPAGPRPPQGGPSVIKAKRFGLQPPRAAVVEGDHVTLAVRSADGTHGIEIKKLKIRQDIPRGGSVVTVAFTAPAPGNYDIVCSEYCGRGHKDMKGTLVVIPRTD